MRNLLLDKAIADWEKAADKPKDVPQALRNIAFCAARAADFLEIQAANITTKRVKTVYTNRLERYFVLDDKQEIGLIAKVKEQKGEINPWKVYKITNGVVNLASKDFYEEDGGKKAAIAQLLKWKKE